VPQLKRALRLNRHHAIARDVRKCSPLLHVLRFFPNHPPRFDFQSAFSCAARITLCHSVRKSPTSFHTQDRFSRNFSSRTPAHDPNSSAQCRQIPNRSHARPNPRRTLHHGQRIRIDHAQFLQRLRRLTFRAQYPPHAAKIRSSSRNLSSPAAPHAPFRTARSLSFSSRNARLRRVHSAAASRSVSKLVPHRAGLQRNQYRVGRSRWKIHVHIGCAAVIASQNFQKATHSFGNPKKFECAFRIPDISASHNTPWHAAFRRFLAAYKSLIKTKFVFGIKHRHMRAVA